MASRSGAAADRQWLGSVLERDHEVRRKIAAANPEIASLCEIGLRLLNSGVALLAGAAQPAEVVMAMAASQVANSIRGAVDLAFGGYAVQSLALTRLAAEYWLLFMYMRRRPDEADGWLDFAGEPAKRAGDLAQVVFADDAGSSATFRELRQVLHRFAHQDNLGLAAIHKGTEAGTTVLQLGSDPDPHHLAAAAYPLLLVVALAADSIARAYGKRDEAWTRSVAQFGDAVVRWQGRVARKEEERLRALGLLGP